MTIEEKRWKDLEKPSQEKMETVLKNWGITNYQFSENIYESWDVEFRLPDGSYIVGEIKDRRCNIDKFATEGYIIENEKWYKIETRVYKLKQTLNTDEIYGLYINFFQNDSVCMWLTNQVKSNDFEQEFYKSHTYQSYYNVPKLVAKLTLDKAWWLGYLGNPINYAYQYKLNYIYGKEKN